MNNKIIIFISVLVNLLIQNIFCEVEQELKQKSSFREETKLPIFLAGEINLLFNYQFKNYPGKNHLGILENKVGIYQVLGHTGLFYIKTPLFKSTNSILSDSNIKIQFEWEFNWMQGAVGLNLIFKPFSFYATSFCLSIGSGWDWMWDQNGDPVFSGLGLNTKNGFISMPLLGPVLKMVYLNSFSFDFSSLPVIAKKYKQWTHVIIAVNQYLNYQALLTVDENTLYNYILTDNNLNGWDFQTDFIIGYKLPVIEDATNYQSFRKLRHHYFAIFFGIANSISFSISHFNQSIMKDGWGSDFITYHLQPGIKLYLPNNFNIKISADFCNGKKYTEETYKLYLFDRKYEDWYFKFNSVGLNIGWVF